MYKKNEKRVNSKETPAFFDTLNISVKEMSVVLV